MDKIYLYLVYWDYSLRIAVSLIEISFIKHHYNNMISVINIYMPFLQSSLSCWDILHYWAQIYYKLLLKIYFILNFAIHDANNYSWHVGSFWIISGYNLSPWVYFVYRKNDHISWIKSVFSIFWCIIQTIMNLHFYEKY